MRLRKEKRLLTTRYSRQHNLSLGTRHHLGHLIQAHKTTKNMPQETISWCQGAVLDDLRGTLLTYVHLLSVNFLACMANSLLLVWIWFLWARSNSCCSQQKFPTGAIGPQCLFHVFAVLQLHSSYRPHKKSGRMSSREQLCWSHFSYGEQLQPCGLEKLCAVDAIQGDAEELLGEREIHVTSLENIVGLFLSRQTPEPDTQFPKAAPLD